MEEFQSVNDEINNLFQEVSQDCYNQGRRDLEKNEKKIPHSFLDSFSKALVDGIIFGDKIPNFFQSSIFLFSLSLSLASSIIYIISFFKILLALIQFFITFMKFF